MPRADGGNGQRARAGRCRRAPPRPANRRSRCSISNRRLRPLRLKARYKVLVKLHHPDAHGGDKAAEEKLKIINQAYATLKASYFD